RSARYTEHSSAALDEARYLLALALTREAGKAGGRNPDPSVHADGGQVRAAVRIGPGPSIEGVVEPEKISWAIERTLAWAGPLTEAEFQATEEPGAPATPPSAAKQKSLAPELVLVRKDAARPEESLVQASIPHVPVHSFLDRLASVCGFATQWSPGALQQVK